MMEDGSFVGGVIVSILVFSLIGLFIFNSFGNELESKSYEVHCVIQEMRKEIIELAEENDNFIREYEGVIELAGGEDIFDDYYHNSTAFEVVLGEFENDIEDIGW